MRTTLPYYTSVVLLASLLVSSAQAQHDETSSTLLRRNRKVLDVNQWLEDHPVIDEKTPPQVHTQAATAASTSASAPCNGVLCDLFDETSRHLLGSMSMSLSMSYPSAPTSPTTPTSPSVPTAPTVPTTPTVPTPSAPSASIVPAPTSSEECTSLTRMDAFVQQLQVYTDISLLLNPVTPQGMALMWLVNTDTTTDPCMTPNLAQRYGLVVLYYSTDGATSWSNSEGWLTASTSECTWFGVTCDGSTAGVTAVVLRTYYSLPVATGCSIHYCISGIVSLTYYNIMISFSFFSWKQLERKPSRRSQGHCHVANAGLVQQCFDGSDSSRGILCSFESQNLGCRAKQSRRTRLCAHSAVSRVL